ncbi:hypothetical protein ONZ45_g6675 [Pleurotus djamor]|nr:hypothetical protein ONZ45_g6675 [Pleurotus djamor]
MPALDYHQASAISSALQMLQHWRQGIPISTPFDMDDLPEVSTPTFIGITVAVSGNVLISLALNIQKLAHRRLEADKQRKSKERSANRGASNGEQHDVFTNGGHVPGTKPAERIPLTNGTPRDYGARDSTGSLDEIPHGRRERSSWGWLIPLRTRRQPIELEDDASLVQPVPVDVVTAPPHNPDESLNDDDSSHPLSEGNESDYLKSKLWWLGFLLMNVGEVGNFISYAFAPASLVAPLGTFALIANCIFAPLMLGERFRKRDLLGMFIAIVGAVTVVLSSNSSDVRLDPDALLAAICQIPFVVYCLVYIVAAIVLTGLSHGPIGRRWVFVDVGLCAIFGGFTVLSTKAISTLLTLKGLDMFTSWITYPVLLVLAGTGVGQIRHLNRALMQFDSKIVIPIQFVLFNLSAIIGSAILYGDFRTAKFHQIVTFLYGCAATFVGVFVIAWAPNASVEDDEDEEGIEGAESTPLTSPRDDHPRGNNNSIGRRRRATLIIPEDVIDAPLLRHKRSTVAIAVIARAHTTERIRPVA